jgi:hypothetical protein
MSATVLGNRNTVVNKTKFMHLKSSRSAKEKWVVWS